MAQIDVPRQVAEEVDVQPNARLLLDEQLDLGAEGRRRFCAAIAGDEDGRGFHAAQKQRAVDLLIEFEQLHEGGAKDIIEGLVVLHVTRVNHDMALGVADEVEVLFDIKPREVLGPHGGDEFNGDRHC